MKRTSIIILAVVLLIMALCIIAYPWISNYLNDKYQSIILTEYEKDVEVLDDAEIQEAVQAARAYNENLSPIRYNREAIEAAAFSYDEVLNLQGSGLIGYIEIPKIDVNLPIYHGTSEEVLQNGIGHLIGSSFPVGGNGAHAVLTGHSGVAGKRLFSDLDQLAQEDMFFLHVLGDTLAYQVVAVNTVLPYETDLLMADPDQDLCTLVTCTPYGVNSHRLLVRGSRVAYEEAAEEIPETTEEPTRSTWKENYLKGLAVGGSVTLGALFVGLLVLLVFKKQNRRHRDLQQPLRFT